MSEKTILVVVKDFFSKKKNIIFFISLMLSSIVWLIIKLAKDYEGDIQFSLSYKNLPNNITFSKPPPESIFANVKSIGRNLLMSKYWSYKLEVDLSKLKRKGNQFFIISRSFFNDIKSQVEGDIFIVKIMPDTLYISLDTLIVKKIPVRLKGLVNLEEGFYIEQKKVIPDSVEVIAYKELLDSIAYVDTNFFTLNDINDDFKRKISLKNNLDVKINPNEIIYEGQVARISEEIITVSVETVNIPEHISIKLFPDKVDLLCKGSFDRIRKISSADFRVVFDYVDYKLNNQNPKIKILSAPKDIEIKILLKENLEVIIRQ